VLPRAKLGDEDLALTAILDAPDLAREAHAQLPSEATDGIDGFTEYDPEEARPSRFGDAERKQIEALFRAELEARDRTSYCAVEVSRETGRLKLEIEYGKRPKTREKLDADTLSVAPTTDINTERAFAVPLARPDSARDAGADPHGTARAARLYREASVPSVSGTARIISPARATPLSSMRGGGICAGTG